MFLPRASDSVLFHAVLSRDYALLADQLERLAPEQVLAVRDSDQRTLYHYAALSSSAKMKDLVFSHAVDHYDRILDSNVGALMDRSHELKRWTGHKQRSGWIPPKVKELQRIATQRKYDDLRAVCTATDRHERTFLHYVRSSERSLVAIDSRAFIRVACSR